jgi:hypothetical protein
MSVEYGYRIVASNRERETVKSLRRELKRINTKTEEVSDQASAGGGVELSFRLRQGYELNLADGGVGF